jgi:hypothetical protein
MREARMTHQLLNPKRSIHNNLVGFGGLNSAIGARHAMNKQDMMLGLRYALPDSVSGNSATSEGSRVIRRDCMSANNIERQPETKDRAQAKQMIKTILKGWDHLTWNELLADDIILSFRSGKVDISRLAELPGYGNVFQATGQKEVKHVLASMYGDLRKDLSVTTDFISGYHVILLGKLIVHRMIGHIESFPLVIYLELNLERKIKRMTIAIVSLPTCGYATAPGPASTVNSRSGN